MKTLLIFKTETFIGNFDIEIFPDGTQVSLRFDVFIDTSQITNSKIKVNNIVSLTNGVTMIRTSDKVFTGVLPLADIQAGKTARLRVTFEWINSDDPEDMKVDTNLALSETAKIEIPVTVDFFQYKGETIEQYVEPTPGP